MALDGCWHASGVKSVLRLGMIVSIIAIFNFVIIIIISICNIGLDTRHNPFQSFQLILEQIRLALRQDLHQQYHYGFRVYHWHHPHLC